MLTKFIKMYSKHPFLMFLGTVLLMYFVVLPTGDDAIRAYKNTESGDKYRLFQYYTTVRYQGVTTALELYGVK